MMRDVLSTHRDISFFGLRHRTWLFIVIALFLLQSWLYLRSGGSSSSHSSGLLVDVERAGLARFVSPKRVAIVVPLFKDHSAVLKKRFASWNRKRKPCLEGAGLQRLAK
jgi:hypothetical protein